LSRRGVVVAKAIGRLDPRTVEKEVADPDKKLVRVTLRAFHFPEVRVSYLRKLKDTDQCRIEAVEVPARVEHRLVCARA
jgi:hypothetical protein